MAVTLLRPPSWLSSADPDRDDVVQLAIEEVSLHGPAQIVNVRPTSGVARGPGRVVLATVRHRSAVLALRIGDDQIFATANHPLYSSDRHDWVQAGDLVLGERIESRAGHVVLRGLAERSSSDVHNLQVETSSEYLVGTGQLRVHNTYPKSLDDARRAFVSTLAARVAQQNHIVLGLRAFGLESTAKQIGGRTLLRDPNWRMTLMTAVTDDSVQLTVSLRGFGGATRSRVMAAVARGASGRGGATDWELAQLYRAGRLETATFLDDAGRVVEIF